MYCEQDGGKKGCTDILSGYVPEKGITQDAGQHVEENIGDVITHGIGFPHKIIHHIGKGGDRAVGLPVIRGKERCEKPRHLFDTLDQRIIQYIIRIVIHKLIVNRRKINQSHENEKKQAHGKVIRGMFDIPSHNLGEISFLRSSEIKIEILSMIGKMQVIFSLQ
jgi:hypothetical protein